MSARFVTTRVEAPSIDFLRSPELKPAGRRRRPILPALLWGALCFALGAAAAGLLH